MKDTPAASRFLTVRTSYDGGDEVEVVVADRGHGIAPDKLSGVFDSFFTTKSEGMGLGLSIARSIVRSHRGRIWAENGPTAARRCISRSRCTATPHESRAARDADAACEADAVFSSNPASVSRFVVAFQ